MYNQNLGVFGLAVIHRSNSMGAKIKTNELSKYFHDHQVCQHTWRVQDQYSNCI